MPTTTLKYFAFRHLPPKLQAVSAPINELAGKLEMMLPDGPETSAGMRKLLEAKDCFVRSALDMPDPEPEAEASQGGRPEWQTRVIEERDDLAKKIRALGFALGPADPHFLSSLDRARLMRQGEAMSRYLSILDERISAF